MGKQNCQRHVPLGGVSHALLHRLLPRERGRLRDARPERHRRRRARRPPPPPASAARRRSTTSRAYASTSTRHSPKKPTLPSAAPAVFRGTSSPAANSTSTTSATCSTTPAHSAHTCAAQALWTRIPKTCDGWAAVGGSDVACPPRTMTPTSGCGAPRPLRRPCLNRRPPQARAEYRPWHRATTIGAIEHCDDVRLHRLGAVLHRADAFTSR